MRRAPSAHVEDTFDLAAEVGMARGVDDVDLNALVVDGNILGRIGHAALTFLIVRIEDAFGDFLVFSEYVGSPKKAIDHGRLSVVDVRDDCDVANVFLFHALFFLDFLGELLYHLQKAIKKVRQYGEPPITMVEHKGIEPLTSGLQSPRSPS